MSDKQPTDGRKRLRAHWPPRGTNHISVDVGPVLYADLYEGARVRGHSLGDEVRTRLLAFAEVSGAAATKGSVS